jgi:heme-degrading monooxygenase HmoA
MHARAGKVSFSSDKADEVTRHVKENVVPRLQEQDGFKGFTLLLDKSNGEGVGLSFWESEEAMRATEDISKEARSGAAGAGGGEDRGFVSYEVAIDTMA